jgi:hypothetical protein
MAEGLSHYIKASIVENSLQGLPLHGIQPTNSHSQFVDDTMLMGTPIATEAQKLNHILFYFSEASGTYVNIEKSRDFFFNTPLSIQNHISYLLGIP